MTKFLRRSKRRRMRGGLLFGAIMLVLLVPAAAFSGGGDKAPPGQEKTVQAEPVAPAAPAHPAHPAHPAKPVQPATPVTPAAHPVKPATKTATSPGKSDDAQHHVIICHRTGSATNPYVVINVSIRAWLHGHRTHPALDGRNDILLEDPEQPGEKLPVARCTTAAGTTPVTTTTAATTTPVITPIVIAATTPNVPTTTPVREPVVIVVNTTPHTTVTVQGAGVGPGGTLGAAKTVSNKHGRATITVVPTKAGILTIKAGNKVIKRVGVLGATKSGAELTG